MSHDGMIWHASAKLQSILLAADSIRGLANCLPVPRLPHVTTHRLVTRGTLLQVCHLCHLCPVVLNQAAERSANLLPAIALTTSKTKPTLCCRRSSCEKFYPALQLGHSKARPLQGLLQGNLHKITSAGKCDRRQLESIGGILGWLTDIDAN